jgi:FMN phosphatase YigB (HAD superfamily)
MRSSFTHVLVLDFDGTVCLGDAPVLAYARLLDDALAAADARGLVEGERNPREHVPREDASAQDAPSEDAPKHDAGSKGASDHDAPSEPKPSSVQRLVEQFLTRADGRASGGPSDAATESDAEPVTTQATEIEEEAKAAAAAAAEAEAKAMSIIANSVDGYEAAERLARARGITDEQLSNAYAGSRHELASGALETTAPAGLAALLDRLPKTTQIVLVTNAPESGVTQQLRLLGLADHFDEIVTSARKPAGMGAIVERLLEQNELSGMPSRLLSVGDIWRNDLAPAAALGCQTALIERLAAPDALPTYRATTIESLYPAITAWAASD